MPNFNQFNNLYLKWQQKAGEWSGQLMTIKRPNYTIVDQEPSTLFTGIRMKVERTGPNFAISGYIGAEYYAVFGDRKLFQPGDMIFSSTSTPPVTVLNYSPIEECVAIKTEHKGKIMNGEELIYNNIYFDFIGVGYPGSELDREMRASLDIPSVRVIMHSRQLQTSLRNAEGLMLVQTDGIENLRWMIRQIDQSGDLYVLHLKQAVIE